MARTQVWIFRRLLCMWILIKGTIAVCDPKGKPVVKMCQLGFSAGPQVMLDVTEADDTGLQTCNCSLVAQTSGTVTVFVKSAPNYGGCLTSLDVTAPQFDKQRFSCLPSTLTVPVAAGESIDLKYVADYKDCKKFGCSSDYCTWLLFDDIGGNYTVTCSGPPPDTTTTTSTTTTTTQKTTTITTTTTTPKPMTTRKPTTTAEVIVTTKKTQTPSVKPDTTSTTETSVPDKTSVQDTTLLTVTTSVPRSSTAGSTSAPPVTATNQSQTTTSGRETTQKETRQTTTSKEEDTTTKEGEPMPVVNIIIPAAVGGVVFFALVLGIIVYCKRRMKKRRNSFETPIPVDTPRGYEGYTKPKHPYANPAMQEHPPGEMKENPLYHGNSLTDDAKLGTVSGKMDSQPGSMLTYQVTDSGDVYAQVQKDKFPSDVSEKLMQHENMTNRTSTNQNVTTEL